MNEIISNQILIGITCV